MEVEIKSNDLIQLKFDFIQFMAQTGLVLGYDPAVMSVLYTLLLENTYITKEKIIKLTGLRKRVVSNVLSELTDPSSNFHVLKTKKLGERQKYYKTSFSYEQYIQTIFILSIKGFTANIEAIPILISRLNHLRSKNDSSNHVKAFLTFFYQIVNCYGFFVQYSSLHVAELFENPDFLVTIVDKLESVFFQKIPEGQPDLIPSSDSLLDIKKDWLRYLQNFFGFSTQIGKKRIESGQVIILHTLHLENKPLNQTQIMNMTGFSRGNVSEILSELVKTSTVRTVKKGRDRKKYFELNVNISDLILAKYNRIKSTYSQIRTIIENRFLSELSTISDQELNNGHIEHFFKEMVNLYRIAEDHISHLLNFLQEKEIR